MLDTRPGPSAGPEVTLVIRGPFLLSGKAQGTVAVGCGPVVILFLPYSGGQRCTGGGGWHGHRDAGLGQNGAPASLPTLNRDNDSPGQLWVSPRGLHPFKAPVDIPQAEL